LESTPPKRRGGEFIYSKKAAGRGRIHSSSTPSSIGLRRGKCRNPRAGIGKQEEKKRTPLKNLLREGDQETEG